MRLRHPGRVSGAPLFTPDGKALLAAGRDGAVRLRAVRPLEQLAAPEAHTVLRTLAQGAPEARLSVGLMSGRGSPHTGLGLPDLRRILWT